MALTPELSKLKSKLEAIAYKDRTSGQDRLLAELEAIDDTDALESLGESALASVTKMTSPGGGPCACCGR